MKYLLLFLLMSVSLNYGYAHDPNQAFFTITPTDSTVSVKAELPWTARNALLLFKPILKVSKNKIDYELAFKEYIIDNLKFSSNNEILPFIDFKDTKISGHSHQSTYTIRFKGNKYDLIENTLLFNRSDKQRNHHTLHTSSKEITFVTSKDSPTYKVQKNNYWSYIKYSIFILLTIAILFFIKRIKDVQTEKGV